MIWKIIRGGFDLRNTVVSVNPEAFKERIFGKPESKSQTVQIPQKRNSHNTDTSLDSLNFIFCARMTSNVLSIKRKDQKSI